MAADPAIAALIREVLAEELARLRPGTREERVRIADDGDLAAFARRVLAIADDRGARDGFERGTLVFRLDRTPGATGGAADGSGSTGAGEGGLRDGRAVAPLAAPAPGTVRARSTAADAEVVESGLLSERHVERLPPGTACVRIGPQVRMTPLARDRLRRRGIAIERLE